MEFVNYEMAKLLKEKGFRELCLAYYTNDDTLYYNYSHKAGVCYKDCYLSHNLMPENSVSGKFVDAPTIADVLEWLRKEKSLHIALHAHEVGWCFFIVDLNNIGRCIYVSECEYQNYEQTALAGINHILNNLILP